MLVDFTLKVYVNNIDKQKTGLLVHFCSERDSHVRSEHTYYYWIVNLYKIHKSRKLSMIILVF